MSDWLYTIRERFTPESGEGWRSYVSSSGFTRIVELVTLDSMMCHNLVTELRDEDWDFNVQEDCRTELFRDPDYLMGRQPFDQSAHQLLGIIESPNGHETLPTGFIQCGFDIMDSYFSNSTLTNCGQIPEAFTPSDVNDFGLLPDCNKAIDVRDTMRRLQPEDPHLGDCDVWLIARRLPDA